MRSIHASTGRCHDTRVTVVIRQVRAVSSVRMFTATITLHDIHRISPDWSWSWSNAALLTVLCRNWNETRNIINRDFVTLHRQHVVNMFLVSATKLLPVCCPSVAGYKGIGRLQVEMNSNYVAEIHSTCIPNEQLVAGQHVSINIYVSGYKLLVRATCCRATYCPGVSKTGFDIIHCIKLNERCLHAVYTVN